MDVLAEVQGENAEAIRRMLTKASDRHASILCIWDRLTIINLIRYKKDIPIETRGLLLVVSVLIATVSYEAAVNPPSNKNDNKSISLILNFAANSSTPNNTVHCSLDTSTNNNTATPNPLFWTSNILGLSSSVLSVILLLPGKYLLSLMYGPLYCFMYCYAMTTWISGSWLWSTITFLLWFILSCVLMHVYNVSTRIRERKKRLSLVLLQDDLH